MALQGDPGQSSGQGRLAGKVAIVTGAGQQPGPNIGNGRATAILFAREGARVLLLDREQAAAEETAREIESAGGEAAVVAGDVSVEDDCRAAVLSCTERFGTLDIVHHNVGIARGDNWCEAIELERWERVMRVNAILPGLIDTPMGVDSVARALGVSREDYAAKRDQSVPLKGGMGSAWDIARAALFLASDEARFITGVLLTVDGGQSARVG